MNLIKFQQVRQDVVSPCVSNCALDDDDICLGCSRHIDEIVSWRHLDNQGKTQVLERCQQRKKIRNS